MHTLGRGDSGMLAPNWGDAYYLIVMVNNKPKAVDSYA